MRTLGLLLATTLVCSFGCGPLAQQVPRPGWMQEIGAGQQAPPADECRYRQVRIQSSSNATAMSEQDERLTAWIAELMEAEFAREGFRTTTDEEAAYLSLLILAGEEQRLGGYVFTGLVSIRERRESHESGIDRYASTGEVGRPSFYHGVSWGPKRELQESVRSFVQKADAALTARVHELCEFDRLDRKREEALDHKIAEYLSPL
jgi:hypothetical protein